MPAVAAIYAVDTSGRSLGRRGMATGGEKGGGGAYPAQGWPVEATIERSHGRQQLGAAAARGRRLLGQPEGEDKG